MRIKKSKEKNIEQVVHPLQILVDINQRPYSYKSSYLD